MTRFPDDGDLLYDQAMMAEKINRIDEMERLFRKVIEVKPDHHHAYNALGYSLADRGLRLPEAKQLIEKAVSMAPDDAYIQDSLGWVEFKMGNTAQSRWKSSGRLSKSGPTRKSQPTWARCCGPTAPASRP